MNSNVSEIRNEIITTGKILQPIFLNQPFPPDFLSNMSANCNRLSIEKVKVFPISIIPTRFLPEVHAFLPSPKIALSLNNTTKMKPQTTRTLIR